MFDTKDHHQEKHEFALFFAELTSLIFRDGVAQGNVLITDKELIHRIVSVLRLKVGDICILFDRLIRVRATITTIEKKYIYVVFSSGRNAFFSPKIIFLLPLLKKDDYERALYDLTAVGVTTIQLITTKKSAHSWNDAKDGERARRIIIAAAEQSKNFAFPDVKAPIPLDIALKVHADKKIFFDADGTDFFTNMTQLQQENPQTVMVLVGPEGDLTHEEKELVKKEGFICWSLTPTVLRSVQAAALGAGSIRSLFAEKDFLQKFK